MCRGGLSFSLNVGRMSERDKSVPFAKARHAAWEV